MPFPPELLPEPEPLPEWEPPVCDPLPALGGGEPFPDPVLCDPPVGAVLCDVPVYPLLVRGGAVAMERLGTLGVDTGGLGYTGVRFTAGA